MVLQKREFSGENIFSLIDNIALQLRYDLEIPPSHIESTDSLSIADIIEKESSPYKPTEAKTFGMYLEKTWYSLKLKSEPEQNLFQHFLFCI